MENKKAFNITLEMKELIQNGYLKELTGNELKVMLYLQALVSPQGTAFPSQQTISEKTGISRKTVGKLVRDMEDKKLIDRTLVGNHRKMTVYKVTEPEVNEENKNHQMTAKDFVTHFCKVFYEVYGRKYNVTWGRDIGMVNNKLIGNYTDEQLKAIIEIGVRQYQTKWATTRYPSPSVGMCCTWLPNTALEVLEQDMKKAETIKEAEEQDLDRFFENGVI